MADESTETTVKVVAELPQDVARAIFAMVDGAANVQEAVNVLLRRVGVEYKENFLFRSYLKSFHIDKNAETKRQLKESEKRQKATLERLATIAGRASQ